MAIFTLRLSDYEADALERLSYINGMSKNKYIKFLLAKAYAPYASAGTVAHNEIIDFENLPEWPELNRLKIENMIINNLEVNSKQLELIEAMYIYVLDKLRESLDIAQTIETDDIDEEKLKSTIEQVKENLISFKNQYL